MYLGAMVIQAKGITKNIPIRIIIYSCPELIIREWGKDCINERGIKIVNNFAIKSADVYKKTLVIAGLDGDFNRKPFGFEECKYSEILDKDSNSIVKTDKRDAEAISISPLNQIIVSFERSYGETAPNRLWSYSVRNSIFSNAKDYFLPQDDKLIKNKGFEAISFLGDDRLIMMSETYVDNIDSNNPKRKYFKGLLLKNGKKDKEIFLERERLRPTDFEELPSGDILILEHDDHSEKGDNGMRKNTVRISRLFCEEGPITNGGILKRDIYHKFHRVDYLDNFEAIASRTDTDGSTVIYILSDNNMNPPDEQENVLLKFKIN